MTEVDVNLADVVAAAARLAPYVDPTPVLKSAWLSEHTGAHVYLKCENLQHTGSFKVRGALSKLLTLTGAERTAGVITASAGNHAQGVAYGSSLLGLSALIVVPETTPAVKLDGIRRYGAGLVLAGSGYDEAHREAERLRRESGRTYIHAYLDPAVVAGQGTVAWESMTSGPPWDVVVVPAGGGGLIAGIGTVTKALYPAAEVLGIQSEASPPWVESFRAGRAVTVTEKPTLADGLAGGIDQENYTLVRRVTDAMRTVSEPAIAGAMASLVREHRLVVEGSGAVGVAALLTGVVAPAPGSRVLVILSGGNVDSGRMARILAGETAGI